jgi:subtilisin family serine protease
MRLRPNQLAILSIAIVACALLLALVRGGGAARLHLRAPAATWEGLVGASRPPVALGQRMIVILRRPSLSTHVAHAGLAVTASAQRRWTSAAFRSQQAVFRRLLAAGIQVRPEYRYGRVLNGFSAPLDGAALSLLEANDDVAAIYPVRAAYPAGTVGAPEAASGLGAWDGARLPGFDGRGLTVALLDTGVDSAHPSLVGRIAEGYDVISRSRSTEARPRPGSVSDVEEHGTEAASLVARVAAGASIRPIRVAGWQRDADREWAVFARTDQIIAGLERAVDADGDRAAVDAARVAVVPLAEPFAAFPDGPLARAAAGAARLGTLVVAPTGNDGPAAAVFGNVAAPGSAPAALTVGAADLRPRARETRVVVRAGLTVLLDRPLALAGSVGPQRPVQLELVTIGGPGSSTPTMAGFFDGGYSRVAGRAVLIPSTTAVKLAVERAVRAGAKAVFFYGAGPPPGALGASAPRSVPVVTLPGEIRPLLAEARRAGARVAVALGPSRTVANASAGRVVSFSSRGLAFGGEIKPDLLAPGVGLAAAQPGVTDDGAPRSATVSGSSAAAAIVAGAAVALAQARPDLDVRALKSVLVGAADSVRGDAIGAQGGGLVDVQAAAAREVASIPATLSLGPVGELGPVRGTLKLRNVSTRRLTLYVSAGPPSDRRAVSIAVSPSRVELPAGEATDLRVRAVVRKRPPRLGALQGDLLVSPVGGAPIRIPWTLGFRPARLPLLAGVRLSAARFAPSDASPAVLAFQAGRLLSGAGGASVQPVSRLDIELWDATGRKQSRVGLLARLRDLLPGRYAFGLTGRDPNGKVLPRGKYRLRLVAFPTLRGAATRRTIGFEIVRRPRS